VPTLRIGDVIHRINSLAPQQEEGGCVIHLDIVKWICNDFEGPRDRGHRITNDQQLSHTEQKAADADREPDQPDRVPELGHCGPGRQGAKEIAFEPDHQRTSRPESHQHHFAHQVVADLNFFFVFVGGLVDLVVPFGLEEEMSRLAAGHRDTPGQQGGIGGVNEQQTVGGHKAQGTEEVQALVDPAMVVVAVIVPAQDFERLEKLFHGGPVKKGDSAILALVCDVLVTEK